MSPLADNVAGFRPTSAASLAPAAGSDAARSSTASAVSCAGESHGPLPLDFAQLVRRCMGRTELAERLLVSFHDRFPKETDDIRRCRSEGDLTRLARLIHQLKGTTANVSAPALHAAARALEATVLENRLNEFDGCLVRLDAVWQEFREFTAKLPRTGAALSPHRS